MKLATIDEKGLVTAHYDTKLNKTLPDGALEITDEEWHLSCAGRLKHTDGAWEVLPEIVAPPVDKEALKAENKKLQSVPKMFDQLLIELNLPQDALDRILDKGK